MHKDSVMLREVCLYSQAHAGDDYMQESRQAAKGKDPQVRPKAMSVTCNDLQYCAHMQMLCIQINCHLEEFFVDICCCALPNVQDAEFDCCCSRLSGHSGHCIKHCLL